MAEERRAVPLGKRPLDLFLASFLLMNIPVVLLIESQVLLPASFFPQPLLDAVQWYVHFSGDYLVGDKPAFLQGLVFAEVLFQLPLLIANSYAFIAGMSSIHTSINQSIPPPPPSLSLSRIQSSMDPSYLECEWHGANFNRLIAQHLRST